jgi:hypothetical protein
MDKLTRYRELIKSCLKEWGNYISRTKMPEVETQCVFDEEHDQYLVLSIGWRGEHRIRSTLLHLRLRLGKTWVEEDWTDEGIATELVKAGVPREDIVLGFQPPSLRHLTDFAPA